LSYTINQIVEIIGNRNSSKIVDDVAVSQISIDSRTIYNTNELLFFAINGAQHNAHQFIPNLYKRGVRNFVVSEKIDDLPDANVIVVDDTLTALQSLAENNRMRFEMPVIAVTGSNGKTQIKEWLALILSTSYNVVKSPKSYNSQVGVPLSVWNMSDAHNLAIFEAGISQPNEMAKLAQIIKPNIGIISNLGAAHDEGFANRGQKLAEKLLLFKNCEVIIYNKADEQIHAALNNGNSQFNNAILIGWTDDAFEEYTIPFNNEKLQQNVFHCIAVAKHLGLNQSQIQNKLDTLMPLSMRLEVKEGINNCLLINDAYSNDIDSLSIALDFLNQQKQHKNKTVIISDIEQSNLTKDALKQQITALFNQHQIDKVISIGRLKLGDSHYNSSSDFLSNLNEHTFNAESILIKGARSYQFEKIVSFLSKKEHSTQLEINLNAIEHNFNQYKSILNSNTKVMAMVKAFGYGSGSYEIAHSLQYIGANYLAVAYIDEGVALRNSGIALPIMVMNPNANAFETLIQYNLEPQVYSFDLLDKFIASLNAQQATEYPIHLKLDTGMKRLGFEEDEIEKLASYDFSQVKIASMLSHLAAADDLAHANFTQMQFERFEKMSEIIMDKLNYKPLLHILNSAGVANYSHAQYNMVRIGLGLYGYETSVNNNLKLQPAACLKTKISQIKELQKGETIGYGRKGVANENLTIATIDIGYADGFSRAFSNGFGSVVLHNKFAPIIGNICMDMSFIDVSLIPGAKVGDEVVIFGESTINRGPSIMDLAKKLNTIPYEILTSISSRVKRTYYRE